MQPSDRKKGWSEVTLGNLSIDIRYGLTASAQTTGSHRLIRITDITDEGNLKGDGARFVTLNSTAQKKYGLKIGDLLIARSGSVGRPLLIQQETKSVYASYLIRFRPDSRRIDPEFLFYYCLSPNYREYIAAHRRGAALHNINAKVLSGLPILCPPIHEQCGVVKRIKECLSRIDEIKRMREAVRQETAEVFSSLLTECFGASWPCKTLGSVAVDIRNGWSGRERKDSNPVKMLRLSSVHSRTIDPTESKEIVLNSADRESFRVVKDDVFIVRGNGSKHLVGRSAIAEATYEDVVFNDLLIRIRFTPDILPQFANFALHLPALRRQIEDRAKTAAGIWKINQQRLNELLIPCPPLSVQRTTLERIDQALRLWKQLTASVSEIDIDLLPQAILRKAFAGEL